MSQLPNAALAHVEDAKVRDYLLNPGNLQNQGKAGQFGQYGFVRDQWQTLADALCKHPAINPVGLLSGSGVVPDPSRNQACDERAEQGFAAPARVVHELEEAEVVRQLVLRDTAVRA